MTLPPSTTPAPLQRPSFFAGLMLHTAALPFVLRREHGAIENGEVTSTRESLHGLLRLDGERLVVQWRTTREISRVGRAIRTDHELAPIREVAVPLSGIAGAHVRRAWRRWWLRNVLVLTAADLRAFDALTAEDDVPGLVLEHPAEIVLDVRPEDRTLVRDFVSALRLAVSEHRLASYEQEEAQAQDRLLEDAAHLPDASNEAQQVDPAMPMIRRRAGWYRDP